MAKYGRGMDVLHDLHEDALDDSVDVHLTCECGVEFVIELGDLMEVHQNGELICPHCGCGMDVSGSLDDRAWEV